MRDVTITKVMNGYIAKVGCQTLVYETQGALLGALGEYLSDPEGTEKRMIEKYGLKGPMVAQANPVHYDTAWGGPQRPETVTEQCAYDQTRGLGQR